MKLKVFPILILTAIFLEIFFLIIPKNKITPFTPLMFWLIGVILIGRFVWVWKQLSSTLEKSNPKIFKKHAVDIFGKLRLPRDTFKNQKVIDSLPQEGKLLLKRKDSLYPYMFICFILFMLSGFLMVLK